MRDLLIAPFELGFMQRALVISLIVGALGGIVGTYVILRRIAFFADTLTHTVFPGVAIAFVLDGSLYLGALVAGLVSAVLFALMSRRQALDDDAFMAIMLTTFFGLGVVVVSRITTYTNDLVVLLFGRVLTVSRNDIVATVALGGVALLIVAVAHKELTLRAFDPEGSTAQGYRPVLLDLCLNIAVTLVVVASLKAVGTVLVIALLVTPAATAKLVTGSVRSMLIVSATVGMFAGVVGLLISYHASLDHGVSLAAGPTIVTVLTATFVIVVTGVAVVRRSRQTIELVA